MKNEIGFVPLGARFLVEKYVEETKELVLQSGIYVSPTVDDNLEFKRNSGKVLVIGTDVSENGIKNIKEGTVITFTSPHVVSLKGKEYNLVHESNVEMIVL